MITSQVRVLRTTVALALMCGVAAADAPWDSARSPADRDKANTLFGEANELYGKGAHRAAVDKYKQALALWDHPSIHFNMAVALIRLDRILEAADELDTALKYGDEPFSPEEYAQVLEKKRLVRARVGDITVSCAQEDVQVLLDARPWFTCPGTRTQRVLADEHLVVGEATGFATYSHRVRLTGGASEMLKLELRSFDDGATYEYPTPRWIPWTIAGAGAAIVVGGFGMWIAARDQTESFEQAFERECPNRCETDLSDHPALRDQRDSAALKSDIATAMFVGGGAVVVAGTVWAILNRPRRVSPSVEVAPTADGAQAMIRGRF